MEARLTPNAHTHCQAINLLLETVVPYLLIKSTKNLSRGARAAKDNAAEWGKKSLQWSLAQSKLGASSIVGGGTQGNSQRSDNVVPLSELAEGREASSKQLGDLPSTLSRRRIQRQRSTQTVGDQVKRGCEGVVAVAQPLSCSLTESWVRLPLLPARLLPTSTLTRCQPRVMSKPSNACWPRPSSSTRLQSPPLVTATLTTMKTCCGSHSAASSTRGVITWTCLCSLGACCLLPPLQCAPPAWPWLTPTHPPCCTAHHSYVLMFTVVWALAPLTALVNNVLEIRFDSFKVLRNLRRPLPMEDQGIGGWEGALEQSTLLAMPVVAALVVIGTGQLEWWRFDACHNDDAPTYMGPDLNCFNTWGWRLLVGVLLERLGVTIIAMVSVECVCRVVVSVRVYLTLSAAVLECHRFGGYHLLHQRCRRCWMTKRRRACVPCKTRCCRP